VSVSRRTGEGVVPLGAIVTAKNDAGRHPPRGGAAPRTIPRSAGQAHEFVVLTPRICGRYTVNGLLERENVPLYEYQCQKCKAHFEKIQKFSDPPLRRCEKCGGPLEQLLSSPAIQFKGSGWYVTDYARKATSETGKTTPTGETAAKPADGKEKPKTSETSKTPETSSVNK
jgi:putative FmdB family regulatory protein